MPDTIDQQRTELARILGVDSGAIKSRPADWLRLMREGVIVKLHIRRWRAKARLDLDDLGLPEDAEDSIGDLLNLGDKRLLPRDLAKRLEAIDNAGRKALERAGFETYWGTFIPATAFQAWKEQNDEHKARYMAARDELLADYDSIISNLIASYRGAARAAYRRANALHPLTMTRDELRDETIFVDSFARRIRRLIPTASQIYDSFAWEEELSYIPLPSLLASDEAETERLRIEAERQRLEAELARDDLWREVAIRDEADRARRNALAAMNEEVVAQARERKEQLLNGFMNDMVVQLRSAVYNAVTDILATMERNDGKLHPRSVVQLRNLSEQVARLNFFGDDEIDLMLSQVRTAFDQRAELRNAANAGYGAINEKLNDIAVVTRASLLDLGQNPRVSRLVADVPAEDDITQARRRLNLDVAADAGQPELTPRPRPEL
jgi:hypothetical protein